ncbi:MAG: type IV toxin-antitoxin system AbiEi family antitoxin domain-containing protein, partial [Rhodospirillaceae bacterium]
MAAATEISQRDRAVELLKERGVMRRIELSDAGVHPETLSRLVEEGVLIRVSRGLYQLTSADITAPHDLAEVAKLVPK